LKTKLKYSVVIFIILGAAVYFAFPVSAHAHEPIFGIGPRTIWRNGFGIEAEIERTLETLERQWLLNYELLYGVTANWAVTLEVPQYLSKKAENGSSAGFGDVVLRTKYRFFRRDVPGGVYMLAVLGGVKFSTGRTSSATALGSGSTDGFLGLGADYEGRRWLLFATGRYRFNGEGTNNIKRGNVFIYDLAVGIRPKKTPYKAPDLVLMAELNGQVFGDRQLGGDKIAGSGGSRLFGAVGVWLTYRNWAFKPGIQFPIYQKVGLPKRDFTAVFAIEVHY
jgi:hypothetical protein